MQAVLGVANGDVPHEPAEFSRALAEQWQQRGVGCLSVAFTRPHDTLSVSAVRDVSSLLADHGIRVSQFANVNANLVHASPEVRSASVHRVAAAVPVAEALNARMILSGAGSCSAAWEQHFYGPDAQNYSPEAEDRMVGSLTEIAKIIDDTSLVYTVECHQLTTMRSPAVIRRVLDRVDHPRVVANFDPVNLLDSAYAAYTNAQRIPEMVDVVGWRFGPSCHVKDILVGTELVYVGREVAPGRGLVDPRTIIAAAGRLPGPVDLIVEHLTGSDAVAALELVRRLALDSGVELVSGC